MDKKTNLVPIFIHWKDAVSMDHWDDTDNHGNSEPANIYTLGFLIRESKDSIVVCLSRDIDNDSASQSISIPKKWIKKIKRLRTKLP